MAVFKRNIPLKVNICLLITAVFFSLVYLNKTTPIFQQIFAHYFYVPASITLDENEEADFTCIAINCTPYTSLFTEDLMVCSPRSIKTRYIYEVAEEKFSVTTYSYIKSINCNNDWSGIYYYPLIPEWSVINKDFPSGSVWEYFIGATKIILSIWVVTLITIFLLQRSESKPIITAEDHREFILIAIISLPLLIMGIGVVVNVPIRNYIWLLPYAPSFLLSIYYYRDRGKLRWLMPVIMGIVLIVMHGAFVILSRPIFPHFY